MLWWTYRWSPVLGLNIILVYTDLVSHFLLLLKFNLINILRCWGAWKKRFIRFYDFICCFLTLITYRPIKESGTHIKFKTSTIWLLMLPSINSFQNVWSGNVYNLKLLNVYRLCAHWSIYSFIGAKENVFNLWGCKILKNR